MTDAALTGSNPQQIDTVQHSYMAQVRRRQMYGGLTLGIFVLLMVSGFMVADDRNAGGFWAGWHQMLDFPADVLSEAWEKRANMPASLVKFFPALLETINIAAASTLFGAMLGLVLSLLSTRGLALWPRLIPVFRRFMDILRALPEIVVALVLIFVMGAGPIPAMIAIAMHTGGALGKMFSEVAENADLKPVDGLKSTGATWAQTMWLGVLPQVAPNFLSYALLRFEINIRASAILGFVGAGGIGAELSHAMAWGPGRFDEAAAIFLLLFGAIVFFDQLSSRYRNKMTEGHAL